MDDTTPIQILSAGAPKTGVRLCAEAHAAASGTAFALEFATAPTIRERVDAGDAGVDLIVAPLPALAAFEEARRLVAGTVVPIGSISAGVAVWEGAPDPDLSSASSLRDALLSAEMVVYNKASSGQYIATMIEALGIADAVAARTVRTQTGAAAMEKLAESRSPRAIGFGQITEIRLHKDLGVRLVGPLPAEIGKETRYGAGLAMEAADSAAARGLLGFFSTAQARRIFSETGVH